MKMFKVNLINNNSVIRNMLMHIANNQFIKMLLIECNRLIMLKRKWLPICIVGNFRFNGLIIKLIRTNMCQNFWNSQFLSNNRRGVNKLGIKLK